MARHMFEHTEDAVGRCIFNVVLKAHIPGAHHAQRTLKNLRLAASH